jgi:hypothetical protein
MAKVGGFSYKHRIIYSLIGFHLLHLTLLSEYLLDSVGAYPSGYLISKIISAPEYLLPGKDHITMFLTMFFWGSAGFLLGYVQDRLSAAKVKTLRRSDKNMNMTNPYIDKIIKNPENKSIKKGYTPRDWMIIISTVLCASLMALIVILPAIVSHATGHPDRYACSKVETDAQNTMAALANYFAEPDQNEVPSAQDLMRSEGLTIDKNSTVIIDGTIDRIRVAVIENENRCVQGNKFEQYLGGCAGTWLRE